MLYKIQYFLISSLLNMCAVLLLNESLFIIGSIIGFILMFQMCG